MILPATHDRVQINTCDDVNAHIREATDRRVAELARRPKWELDKRLAELDAEWDVERCLETMAPSLSLVGLLFGSTVNRRWLALPIVVQAFFLMHAMQGWCPPLPVMRRLGVRTADEINEERVALKALRGDFRHASDHLEFATNGVHDALNAARS